MCAPTACATPRSGGTSSTGAGDIFEVPLTHHAQIVAGDYAPGGFGFSLHDRDADTLDELLVGKPTPALTDTTYVYFMGTRWSCSSAEAIAFCNLESRLLNNTGAPDEPYCEQAIWWQDDPNLLAAREFQNEGHLALGRPPALADGHRSRGLNSRCGLWHPIPAKSPP